MGEMWKNGEKKPLFLLVGPQLVKDGRKVITPKACGVDEFEAYAGLANEAGIVKIHHERPGEIISLELTIQDWLLLDHFRIHLYWFPCWNTGLACITLFHGYYMSPLYRSVD